MTKRVLVNGCSFTFGHGDTEDRYTGEVLPSLGYGPKISKII